MGGRRRAGVASDLRVAPLDLGPSLPFTSLTWETRGEERRRERVERRRWRERRPPELGLGMGRRRGWIGAEERGGGWPSEEEEEEAGWFGLGLRSTRCGGIILIPFLFEIPKFRVEGIARGRCVRCPVFSLVQLLLPRIAPRDSISAAPLFQIRRLWHN
jgi:hypothetical protein